VEPRVLDVTARNIVAQLDGVDLVMDGADNFETRYLLNDACVDGGVPWIYGGVIGTAGMVMPVVPGAGGPCLRCLFRDPPPPGRAPTCDTAGVLNAAAAAVGAAQVAQGLRVLVDSEPPPFRLVSLEPWDSAYRTTEVRRDEGCPCCGQGQLDFLSARSLSWTSTLCGRNSVQIAPPEDTEGLDLDELARRLEPLGEVAFNGRVLRFGHGSHTLLVFPDGRTIIQGTTDEAEARTLHARFVGG